MTATPARRPLTPVAILDLANTHSTSKVKAIYSFSKRNVIAFAEAIAAITARSGRDALRLDSLLASAGFITGSSSGTPAYRMLGSDTWHSDLRAAIDAHGLAKNEL